ncbi:MAG TPA: YaaL family protein [Bacillota bacterium]|nr:YaaL family protein [Bacillota bacterium]
MTNQPKRKQRNWWNNLWRKLGLNFGRQEVSSIPAEWRKWSENLEMAQREWKYARLYFDSVTDPDLIDHAIYNLEATEKKYTYLLKQAREIGIRGDGYILS